MKKQKVSRFNKKYLIEKREVRFFLSSTFADMGPERSAIVKVFNELKLEARKRNVILSLVDLRWGVTQEESRTGRVLSVCLNEIEHSHPFFLGLLGSRYGSSPNPEDLKNNKELEERYPWLRKDIENGLSITEIEIQYAVLRNPNDVDAAFFINNTPGCLPDSHKRLTRLKDTVRNKKGVSCDDYFSIEDLCQKVRARVLGIMDKYFRVSDSPQRSQEQTTQLAFINSHHSHYIKSGRNHRIIDDFVNGEQQNLVISGPSGIGKSALIANWIKENQDRIPYHIIYYFVGNATTTNDYHHILSYIRNGVQSLCQTDHPHYNGESIETETQRILIEAAEKGARLLIVIDGINQIADNENAKLLNWLPTTVNGKVKFLFSTLDHDETWNTFRRRDYPIRQIKPLTQSQRKRFLKQYLSHVGKTLDREPLDRIISNEQCKNTLVLKTLLDELICFGSFKHLNKRIDYYLAASSPEDFFNRMLKRMEADYSLNQDIVRHVLSLISLSEDGLSEDEILHITGIRQIDWHLFYCAFYNHFITRQGRITFSHQFVSDAVHKRYKLKKAQNADGYRKEIVRHFESPVTDIESRNRQISESAYQYYHLRDGEHLHQTIFSLDAFNLYCTTGLTQFAGFWRFLSSTNSDKYSWHGYLHQPSDGIRAEEMPFLNLGLFSDLYFADYHFSIECYKANIRKTIDTLGKSHPHIAAAYNNIGDDYALLSDPMHALEYYDKALAIAEEQLGVNHPDTCTLYNNIGAACADMADYDTALDYYEKAMKGHSSIWGENHPSIAVDYNNMGSVYCEQGLYDKAYSCFDKARLISESTQGDNHPDTALYYDNLGEACLLKRDIDHAEAYCCKAFAIRWVVFGENHPETASSYLKIGLLYYERRMFETARKFFAAAKTIYEQTLGKKHPDTAEAYNDMGLAYYSLNKYKTAYRYYSLALSIRKEKLGEMHPKTAFSYNNIGVLHETQGNHLKALDCFFKSLRIRENVLGMNHIDTGFTCMKIGSIYDLAGEYKSAHDYYSKALVAYAENRHPLTEEVRQKMERVADLGGLLEHA